MVSGAPLPEENRTSQKSRNSLGRWDAAYFFPPPPRHEPKTSLFSLGRNFVRRGGNPNLAKNSETVENVKEGYSLLHALIAIQNKEAIKMVIDLGANTNVYPITAKKEDKISPLALAAKTGYMNGVRLLLERGSANLHESRGPYGENVLHAAVQSGSDEMVGYILRASGNALLGMRDDNGTYIASQRKRTFHNVFLYMYLGASPLHYACIVGKTRIITLFVRDYQAQPDPRDKKGETPLHYAVRNQKLKAIQKLVGEFGVYPNPYILKQVPTPLDLAKRGGLKAIAEYLRGEGAKTTKEMEKASRSNNAVHSSNSSIMSGESSARGDSGSPAAAIGVRNFLHTKTSQILRGTFDI
ncbi:ankyrin repeat-containing domain protein [Parasitella parasitica]|nr:ankyrin repeat-containing domain protein [Parasitella parasitica]